MDATTAAGPYAHEPFVAGRDPHYDNQPPLEERVLLEFDEDLAREGIAARVTELEESAARAPACDSTATAGKIGDLIKLAADVTKRVDAAREKHNRPLLTTQRALKAKADGVTARLTQLCATLRLDLNRFMAEQARLAEQERRRAADEARRIEEAAAAERQRLIDERVAAGQSEQQAEETAPPPPVVAQPKVEAPVARGDYGARVGARTVWKFEREVPIAKLPKAILENEKVVAAVNQVIGQMVRGGARTIKGIRIYETTEAAVR